MTGFYPIVAQRTLDPAARRSRFRRRERADSDLPRAEPHQVLVYRVNGHYVQDNAQLRAHDEEVVDATAVSVVDMTRDAPVTVQLAIPSAEASDFIVQVAFAATVMDAVQVVREGVRAVTSLDSYLRSHHKIFELGLNYYLRDINEVRKDVNAQITAFTTVRQPRIPGLAVRMASVQVNTPDELREYQQKLREQKWAHELGMDREERGQSMERFQNRYRQDSDYDQFQYEGMREGERARREQLQEVEAARHARHLQLEQARHEQLLETEGAQHTQFIESERREFQRLELSKAEDMIRSDPRQALRMAYAAGQIDATTLAEQFRAEDDRERAVRDRQRELDRADAQQDGEWKRADRRAALEMYQQEKRALTELARQDAVDRRADSQRKEEWEREDRRRAEDARQDQQQRQFAANIEILRELAKRGHLDTVNVNVERLIAGMSGGDERAALTTEERKALDEAPTGQPVEAAVLDPTDADKPDDDTDDTDDADIREEDDYR